MKDSVILSIDTHLQHTTMVSLEINGKKFESVSESVLLKSQMVLPQIETLLQKNKITLEEITGITVHTGPGSFTGIRVGISVANCLATQLCIPVNGKLDLAQAVYTE